MPFEDPDSRATSGWMKALIWAFGLIVAVAVAVSVIGAFWQGWSL